MCVRSCIMWHNWQEAQQCHSMSRLSGKASTKLGLTLNLKFELCGTIDNRPKSVTVCQGCQVNKASIKIRFDLMTLHYVAQLTIGPRAKSVTIRLGCQVRPLEKLGLVKWLCIYSVWFLIWIQIYYNQFLFSGWSKFWLILPYRL